MRTIVRVTSIIFYRSIFLAVALIIGCAVSAHFLQKENRIIFFGDSITQLGVEPKGYVTIIQDSLRALRGEINADVIGAGISGNKVTDLQKRLQHDVLDKKPTVVVIYIGVNDVWHYSLPNLKGTPKEEFEAGLKEIIAAVQNTGARVILCTPSVIGEKRDSTNPHDAMLDEYSRISRQVARETGSTLCDLRDAFTQYLRLHNPNNVERGILTYDRVHLNDEGNRFVAERLLNILKE
jgi:lysophospholipase L1-like esterase